MSEAKTIVLITAANRGLGRGLLKRYLAQPDHIIIALIRNLSDPTSLSLSSLPKGTNSSLIVTQYDASVWESPFNAIKSLVSAHPDTITHLDVVIANAGMATVYPAVKDVKRDEVLDHMEVNALSAVALYQATRELLEKSPRVSAGAGAAAASAAAAESESAGKQQQPVFAIMGSSAGSLSRQPAVFNAAYAPCKSMLHWYGIRINEEDAWLNCFVTDPGWVQTDTGNAAAKLWGVEKAPLTVDESCDGMFDVLTGASKAKFGGKFVLYTGEILSW